MKFITNPMIRIFLILCLFVNSCTSLQNKQIGNFRGHKNCKVVQNFLTKFDNEYASKFSRNKVFNYSNSQGLIGSLAGIFITDQSCTRKILSTSNKLSDYTKIAVLTALVQAELKEDAKEFMIQNSLGNQLADLQYTKNIKATTSEFQPSTNDFLIGAYSSTGDNLYIDNILHNFKTADKKMIKDAIRLGFVTSKFGRPSSPYQDHYVKILQSIKKKYYNEKDPKPFLRLMTLSSAFWALNSIAKDDKSLAKHLKKFFLEGELKDIFLIEQNHFSNYLTTLTIAIVGIGEFNKKSLTKEEKENQEFAKKNKKLILDYEELRDPDIMALTR